MLGNATIPPPVEGSAAAAAHQTLREAQAAAGLPGKEYGLRGEHYLLESVKVAPIPSFLVSKFKNFMKNIFRPHFRSFQRFLRFENYQNLRILKIIFKNSEGKLMVAPPPDLPRTFPGLARSYYSSCSRCDTIILRVASLGKRTGARLCR